MACFQAVAQAADPRLLRPLMPRRPVRTALARPDDVGHVFRARPAAFFLMPADQQRPAGRAALDVQRADALGGVQLVAGKRKQIHVAAKACCRSMGSLAHRLRGIGVKDDRRIGFLRQPRELLDGKDRRRSRCWRA